MKFSNLARIYIAVILVVLGAFAYAGTTGFRVLSVFGTEHWHHEYQPGVHMLRHK